MSGDSVSECRRFPGGQRGARKAFAIYPVGLRALNASTRAPRFERVASEGWSHMIGERATEARGDDSTCPHASQRNQSSSGWCRRIRLITLSDVPRQDGQTASEWGGMLRHTAALMPLSDRGAPSRLRSASAPHGTNSGQHCTLRDVFFLETLITKAEAT